MALTGLTSDTNDLWKYFQQNGQLPQGGQQAFPVGEDIDISQLPPELQKIVKARQSDFSEGNKDKIDTEGEVRKLMEHVIGQEADGKPTAAGMDALKNLSKDEMMALLVDWVLNKQNDPNKPKGNAAPAGADRGNMGGQNFAQTQPASFNSGGGNSGGGNSGGGMSTGGGGGGGTVSAPASPTSSKDLKGNDNAEKAFNYFVSKGLSPAQAAGIVANLQAESGVKPGQHQIGGPAFGIAQWEGGRQDNLKAFAAQQGKPVDDMAVQLDFLWQEMVGTGNLQNPNGPEANALKALMTTNSAGAAGAMFENKFERPRDNHNAERSAIAEQVLAAFGNGGGSMNA